MNPKTEQDPITIMSTIKVDLYQLAKECPGFTIIVSLSDLVEANRQLVTETKEALESALKEQNAETYPSRQKVMEILDVSEPTLWRWAKIGYLVPVDCGGKKRYKMSEVMNILKGKRGEQ